MYKVGIGYDIHKLTEGRKLIVGGINIPFEKGLLGHSDADVLIHAIIDALLGAAGMPDIGTLFPDNDMKYKDINSCELLKKAVFLVKEKGFKINNIDSNIIAQEPKMLPYIPQMKEKLSEILKTENISIKAKTKENLDAVGNCEAIEAQAVAMIEN